MNTSQQLHAAGQSVWYDNVERRLLNNGELVGMIDRGRARAEKAAQFLGQAAVANARLAYNDYKIIF